MKRKMIALLLAMGMTVSFIAGCGVKIPLPGDTSETETTPVIEATVVFPKYEPVYPEVSVSTLNFTLTDADVTQFEKDIEQCMSTYINATGADAEEFKQALYALDDAKNEIFMQRDIAYLLYCRDRTDTESKDNYLYAEKTMVDVNSKFWSFIYEAKQVSKSLKHILEDFEKTEYPGVKRNKSEEGERYGDLMTQIESEYNALGSSADIEQMYELYIQYVETAKEFAKAYGYDNYYEYATVLEYNRDYGKAERKIFRQYVAEYFVPLYKQLTADSRALDAELSSVQYNLSEQYLYSDYETFARNYLFDYFESLPQNAGAIMLEAFSKDRIMIGEGENAFPEAFVYMVGETPILYAHKDAKTLDIFSFELGDYYACSVRTYDKVSKDMRNLCSQGNTMLFINYLDGKLHQQAYESFRAYVIRNLAYRVILFAIKDEFDEIIFSTSDLHTYSAQDMSDIMEDLMQKYGVKNMSSNMTDQLTTYWYRQGISNAAYNISYSISSVMALQIYQMSLTDYEGAVECYCNMVENIDTQSTFIGTATRAGLSSPFDRATYEMLSKLGE